MFLTTCSNVCSHHLYLGIEWSIKYASVFSLCSGRANESRFRTVGGFKKLLYYFLLWKPCECNPRIHYTITTVASTGTCLVPRRFNPPKSINIHPVTPLSQCFTLFHLCLRLGPQSWCATCRLLPIDCSPGGQPILHQGVSALYPSTREGLEVWDGAAAGRGSHGVTRDECPPCPDHGHVQKYGHLWLHQCCGVWHRRRLTCRKPVKYQKCGLLAAKHPWFFNNFYMCLDFQIFWIVLIRDYV